MARIAGINLPNDKRIEAALPNIYGIGFSTAKSILKKAKVDPDKRTKDLTEQEVNMLRELIDKEHKVEGSLRQQVSNDIKRLKEIDSYRGSRHKKGLPARGQRTKTNARTVRPYKGRKTSGSGKRKSELK